MDTVGPVEKLRWNSREKLERTEDGRRGEDEEFKRYSGGRVLHLLNILGNNKYFLSTDSASDPVGVKGIVVHKRKRTALGIFRQSLCG